MILEVLLVLCVISIVLFLLTCNCLRIYLFSGSHRATPIHPDALNSVNNIRENARRAGRQNENNGSDPCPICLNGTIFTIETNCSHKFCATCMIQYWQTTTNNRRHKAVNCPLCRQLVNCLLTSFNDHDNRSDDYQFIMNQINEYNRRFANESPGFFANVRSIPVLLRHLFSETFAMSGLTFFNKVKVILVTVLSFAYTVSPVDLLPEALFGIIGYIDDAIFVFTGLIYLSTMYRQYIANRGR